MITIRKLSTLSRKTCLRKAAALLQGFESDLKSGKSVDVVYVAKLFELIDSGDEKFSGDVLVEPKSLLRVCNTVRHRLLRYLGNEPADWDMLSAGIDGESGTAANRRVLPFSVYLEDIRSPFNVGAIFRTAESFGIGEILLSPDCPSPDHPRAKRSAMGCNKIVPWRIATISEIQHGDPVFLLELGGTPIGEFCFPAAGTVIIGSEELGASPEARNLADGSGGRVTIPMYGRKGSLNVSSAFAILAYSWSNRFFM